MLLMKKRSLFYSLRHGYLRGNFLGHVNFYPNGGRRQPGCLTLIEHYIGCGHRKTPQWFSEFILTPQKFIGCRCSDYESYLEKKCSCANRNNLAVMGESCNINTRGNFYLVVRQGEHQYELGIYPNLISFGFTSTGTINNVSVPTIPLEQYMSMIPHFNYTAVDTAIPDRR